MKRHANITTLLCILIIAVVGVYISLPRNLPVRFTFFNKKIEYTFKRPEVDWRIGGIRINPSLSPHLGLDLQGGAHITFEADMSKIPDSDKDNALESAKNVIERRVNLFGTTEPVIQTAKIGNQRRIIVEIPGVTDSNQAINLIGKTADLRFWEAQTATPSAEEQAKVKPNFGPFTKETDLTGKDLKRAQVTYDNRTGQPQVTIDFTDDGRKKFTDITSRNVQKQVAISLDDQIITAPTVQQAITEGTANITGNFTPDQAKNLAIELNAGALPVPVKVIEQQNVGATLGYESIQKSIIAGIVGLSIVIVFMAIYYGIPGILADIALVIYSLITFALFDAIPITLTLAGIAGFILSIGMAVDANILIFERMREEMRWGKKRAAAIEAGFSRAWTSIRDSNSSSLITCAILFYFGTGIVRGFALTLAIGILVSMFSAIFVTRTFLRFFYRKEYGGSK